MTTKDYSWLDEELVGQDMSEYEAKEARKEILKKIEERERALLEELLESFPDKKERDVPIAYTDQGKINVESSLARGYNIALETCRNLIKERLK